MTINEAEEISNDIWKSSFYLSNPLHFAMYEAGLLKKGNFYTEDE